MYRDKLRIIASIADIHIGVKQLTADEFKYQLYERFIKPISELMILDVITINGDVAHLSLSFNSKLAEVYLWFFDSIMSIAEKKGASVIVIRGTISHDEDQLDNVKFYESDNVFFVDEPTIVETKGMKFYCLPDIHVKSKEEENKLYKYPSDYFDMILGHGSVTETQFIKQESEHSVAKNVIYNTKELLRICTGNILFGHIHAPMRIKERMYYINSFTRFIHGEHDPKGWIISAYQLDTRTCLSERVINDLAFNFNTYYIKPNTFDDWDADRIIKEVNNYIEENDTDRLCLDIKYINTDENIAKIHILRKYYSSNKIVNKLKFKPISRKEMQYQEEVDKKTDDSKSYLLDKSLRFEEKLQRFIEEENGIKIPLEKLETVLTSDEVLVRGGTINARAERSSV